VRCLLDDYQVIVHRKSAKFDANQARLKMGLLAYNLLHLLREFYMEGEEVKRSVEWLIRRIVKVASRVSYHSRYWWMHVASAFPLRHHYQAMLSLADGMFWLDSVKTDGLLWPEIGEM
jgi:hypothetical protein